MDEPDLKPAPGRPRDPRISEAALAATRVLLVEVGYRSMSVDLVARHAGLNRPAMYRRWPSLAHLVHEAVFGPPREVQIVETGDVRADVRAVALAMASTMTRPEVRSAVAGLISDFAEHPELRASVLDGLERSARRRFAGLLKGAAARGEIRRADPDVVLDTINGSLLYAVINGRDVDEPYVSGLVDLVVGGLLIA